MNFTFKSVKGKRDKNEDFYGNSEGELFLVADGLGGHAAGEVASRLAVETSKSLYPKIKDKTPEKILSELFKKADKAILNDARKDRKKTGMGTTIVGAIVKEEEVFVGNVGDSRGYVFRGSKLELVSTDDRDGFGFLTEAIGVSSNKVNVHVSRADVKKGDLILLCTDGLTDFVKEPVIEKILSSGKDLERMAEGLVESALQFGSSDNVTVCLVRS